MFDAIFFVNEFTLHIFWPKFEVFGSKFNHRMFFNIHGFIVIFRPQNLQSGEYQESTENIKDPVEVGNQHRAREDKEHAQDNSTDNTPKQYFFVVLRRYCERIKNKENNK